MQRKSYRPCTKTVFKDFKGGRQRKEEQKAEQTKSEEIVCSLFFVYVVF